MLKNKVVHEVFTRRTSETEAVAAESGLSSISYIISLGLSELARLLVSESPFVRISS